MSLMDVQLHDLESLRLQLRASRKEIAEGLERQSRQWAPMLVRSAQSHARGEVEKRIAQSGTVKMRSYDFTVSFGRTGRLSGGAKLAEVTRPYEFGSTRQNVKTEYLTRHRISRKAYRVKRRTQKQLPPANADGRFLYPALAEVTPRMVSGYVREITNTITDY